jgi:hypothetical protein
LESLGHRDVGQLKIIRGAMQLLVCVADLPVEEVYA